MAKNKNQKQTVSPAPSKGILIAAIVIVLLALLLILWKLLFSTSRVAEAPKAEMPVQDMMEKDAPVMLEEPIIEEEVSAPLDEAMEGSVMTDETVAVIKKVPYVTAENFVNQYFGAYNEQDFEKACGMMDQDKCNANRPQAVVRFAQEFEKMQNGYESVRLWKSQLVPADFHSQVVCVENKYKYKDDLEDKEVIEIMSFYVNEREDSTYEISSRVCESKTFSDGRAGECPFEAIQKFCVAE